MSAVEEVRKDYVLVDTVGGLLLFDSVDEVPVDLAEPRIINAAVLMEMSLDELGDIYGRLAGTNPKKFKSVEIAVESIEYQIDKLAAAATKQVSVEGQGQGGTAAPIPPEGKAAPAPKAPRMFELVATLPNAEKLIAALAPQARAILDIVLEIGTANGTTVVSEADIHAALKVPEIAAKLNTTQEPARIFQYYRSRLISAGLMREVK